MGYFVNWNGGGSGDIIVTPIFDTKSPSIFTYTLVSPNSTPGMKYSFAEVA